MGSIKSNYQKDLFIFYSYSILLLKFIDIHLLETHIPIYAVYGNLVEQNNTIL